MPKIIVSHTSQYGFMLHLYDYMISVTGYTIHYDMCLLMEVLQVMVILSAISYATELDVSSLIQEASSALTVGELKIHTGFKSLLLPSS